MVPAGLWVVDWLTWFSSLQIHAIMLECWSANLEQRPSFKSLTHRVEAARGGMDR